MDQLFSVTGHQIPKNMTKQYLDNIDPWDADAKRRFKSALEISTQKALCSSQEQYPNVSAQFNPTALRKAIIVQNFGLSDCNSIGLKCIQFWPF